MIFHRCKRLPEGIQSQLFGQCNLQQQFQLRSKRFDCVAEIDINLEPTVISCFYSYSIDSFYEHVPMKYPPFTQKNRIYDQALRRSDFKPKMSLEQPTKSKLCINMYIL